MSDQLEVGSITLPPETVTATRAVLGRKRSGKSNLGVVMAEEFHRLGIPWVAVDPKGDWWGVRSMADGSPGLAVPVLGGLHGDLPLEPTAGKLVGNLIAEKSLTMVLDVSEFDSKAAQARFLTDLAETLLRRNENPVHLFLEEADEYLPQQVKGDQAKMVGAWQRLVKRGGFRGLGVTLLTQRSATLNKDVLNMVDGLIVTQTTAPGDKKIATDWIGEHLGGEVDPASVREQLPLLRPGEAYLWVPPDDVHRVRFRRRATFDSGETPKLGKIRKAATLADVDLDAVKAQMAETVEKAKRDDPSLLRARIADLERDLKGRPVETETVVEYRVPGLGAALEALQVAFDTQHQAAAAVLDEAGRNLKAVLGGLVAQRTAVHAALRDAGEMLAAHAPTEAPLAAPARVRLGPHNVEVDATTSRSRPAAPRPGAGSIDPGSSPPGKAELAFLSALAQFPDGLTRARLGMLTGYSKKSSHFSNTLSTLRGKGWIEDAAGPLRITAAGQRALPPTLEAVPRPGRELVGWWLARLGTAEATLLEAIAVGAWPGSITRAELSEQTGYSATSSHFSNTLSRLRTLDLIEGSSTLRATADLMGD